MKYKQLRTNLLIAISVIAISVLAVYEYYGYQVRKDILHQISNEKLFIITKTMRNIEKVQKQIYSAKVKHIQNDSTLQQLLRNADYKSIDQSLQKTFSFCYEETPSLEHVHFYDRETSLVIDSSNPNIQNDNFVDTKQNLVLQEAKKTQKPQSGYVTDGKNVLYYSFIFPLFIDNKINMFIEYVTQADDMFKTTSKAGRYKYAVYVRGNNKNRVLGKHMFTNSALFKNLNLTQEYIDTHANQDKIIPYKNKYYILHQYDIETHFQKDFSQVIMAIDTTKYMNENKEIVLHTAKYSIVVLILVLLLIYLILTKLINKLLEEEKELNHNKNQLQIVIDNSDNLIVLLENDNIVLANSTLLSYENAEDLTSFINSRPNISDLFVKESTTYVSQNAQNNAQWINEILKLDEADRVVALNHKEFGLNYFSVKINIPEDDFNSKIIIFSNISSLYKKSIKDEYMAYHDNLTKIYNRQYFNQAIAKNLLLVNQHKTKSSLMMLDLDYFKNVNDTYGHQTGDDVLRTFAEVISQNIREDDVFARWGGEEFVLLLNNSDEETAFKVAQNLRERIDQVDFPQAGHITCSIGVSQSKIGDTPDAWIARVDKALYSAKENGRNRVELST